MTSYNLITYLLLRRRLTDAVMEDGVFITDRISSPFVIGFIRPRIYMPTGLTQEEMSFIVLHEKAHLRRRDPVIKLLAFLITSLHWFNPFAWIAFLLFSRDIELTCDESVVRNLGEAERKDYSKTLLSIASGRSLLRPMPLAFGDGYLKGRIKNILNYRKPGLWLISLAVVCVVFISVGLLMNPIHAEEIGEIIEDVIETTNNTESAPTSLEREVPETSVSSEITTAPSESTAQTESTTLPSETSIPTESTTVSPETTAPLPDKSNGEWVDSLYGWSAETPADSNSFESIFTKQNYKVSKIPATSQADAVYQAVYPGGKSVITCTVYRNTDLSYRAVDGYMVEMFKDSQSVPSELTPLYFGNLNYFAALDLPHSDSEFIFCGALLSGNIVVKVNIPLDMKEIIPFMRAIQEYGLGGPVDIDGPMPEMPEKASLCSPEAFEAILLSEGFTVRKGEDQENVFLAESADGTVKVDLTPIYSPKFLEYGFLTGLYDSGPTNVLSYRETESYRSVCYSSTYIDDFGLSLEQNGWNFHISAEWTGAPEKEAEQRALVDRLLMKLCFENTALE